MSSGNFYSQWTGLLPNWRKGLFFRPICCIIIEIRKEIPYSKALASFKWLPRGKNANFLKIENLLGARSWELGRGGRQCIEFLPKTWLNRKLLAWVGFWLSPCNVSLSQPLAAESITLFSHKVRNTTSAKYFMEKLQTQTKIQQKSESMWKIPEGLVGAVRKKH